QRALHTQGPKNSTLKCWGGAALRINCFAQHFLRIAGGFIASGSLGFGVFGCWNFVIVRQNQLTFCMRNGVMAEVVLASTNWVWVVNQCFANSAEGWSGSSPKVIHKTRFAWAPCSGVSSAASIGLSIT